MAKTKWFLFLLLLLSVGSFARMLKPGLYSMQDFPYFRVVEYSKCLTDGQIPCRWAPDAGLGFGEPVFNFYSHIPFFFAASLVTIGVSAVSSLKFVFAFSLVASAVGMFFLAKEVWKNNLSAILSAVLYLYAPYRAVNVWVRGALPESFAFVFLPLIILAFEKFLVKKERKWLVVYLCSLSGLILTHNLSVLLFAHAIGAWILIRLYISKQLMLIKPIFLATLGSLCLSAFYLLPAIAENALVNLQTTTIGYFDFRAHFVTVPQLLFSSFWGYGGSTWGAEDGLSLAVGQLQWILAMCAIFLVGFRFLNKRKVNQSGVLATHLVLCGVFYLLLTHNKTAFLWEEFSSVMKYIQFPWRFIGVALFSFALASGYLVTEIKKYALHVVIVCIAVVLVLNLSNFREDLWYEVGDNQMQSLESWIEQSRASIGDYWPTYGPIPTEYAAAQDSISELYKMSNKASFKVSLEAERAVEFPISYFPGWSAKVNDISAELKPSSKGLLEAVIPAGTSVVTVYFRNTPVRTVGNTISVISIFVVVYLYKRKRNYV